MNTIQEKTHTQNKRFHPVKYDKFDLMFNEYIISTVVDKLNLDEWALCKPEMDLNIFSAIFSNFRYHPNATRTKQMFFKKHLFLLKHTSFFFFFFFYSLFYVDTDFLFINLQIVL